jgi:nucleotide-binding universal stress UspA family protein
MLHGLPVLCLGRRLTLKILTIYDGTLQSKTALRYGLRKAKEKGGELTVLQIFQSSLFMDYDAGPKAEEMARAENRRHLREAESLIRDADTEGVIVRVVSVEGDPVEEALQYADKEHTDLILCSPRYKAIVKKASCPVHLMPGTILVPADNTAALLADKGNIIAEAKATGSKVLLLGIVPVHLYSTGEKTKLARVRNETIATVRKIKNALSKEGVDVSVTIKSGYPDEEILKAAEEYSVSMIMLPAGGKTPSELTKAAAILLDEPERLRLPIQVMQEAAA